MNKLRLLPVLLRSAGLAWVTQRALYYAKLRSGYFTHRLPLGAWEDISWETVFSDASLGDPETYKNHRLRHSPAFFFSPTQVADLGQRCMAWDSPSRNPGEIADQLGSGFLTLFGKLTLETGFPPNWHRNHLTGVSSPRHLHWSCVSDFDYGDIKLIWEMSRFTFTFYLVRAFSRSGKGEYVDLFWLALEDWLRCNPPQAGANWKCGQEVSFRLMAWCFALYGFLDSQASSGARLLLLAKAMNAFGHRIEANIGYALNQKNNHGISEAAGLWTIATLFPELKYAPKWRRLGTELLEKQAQEIIYEDGGSSQQSANYQRLMIQLYTWVVRLGQLNGQAFSAGLLDRLGKALCWSYQLQEPENGRMPNSGGNDGALLFLLNNCDYNDHRPALQTAHYLLKQKFLFPVGPWDEDVLWLFGPSALGAPREPEARSDFSGEKDCFHVLRNTESWAVFRCGAYRHRPVHADLLHLDVWWGGENVALDPGAFSYNAAPPWDNSLAGTKYHNSVCVDKADQMKKAGRFMWLPWARSKLSGKLRSPKGGLVWLEGEHFGYQRLKNGPVHRRAVVGICDQWWVVVDALAGGEERIYRLHWLMKDAQHKWDERRGCLALEYAAGNYQVLLGAWNQPAFVTLARADPESARGWSSPYYQYKEPALSLALQAQASHAILWTVMGPSAFKVVIHGEILHLMGGEFSAQINLGGDRLTGGPLVDEIGVSGRFEDRLTISSAN